jgi:hypothetical protein
MLYITHVLGNVFYALVILVKVYPRLEVLSFWPGVIFGSLCVSVMTMHANAVRWLIDQTWLHAFGRRRNSVCGFQPKQRLHMPAQL